MKIIRNVPKPTNKRTLKVYYSFLFRRYSMAEQIPRIHLCGKWLEKLGFKTGERITVLTSPNRLFIIKGEPKKIAL